MLKGRISDEIPYRVDFFDEDTMSVVISNSISEFVITLKSPDEPAPAAEGRGHGAKNQPAVKPAKPL